MVEMNQQKMNGPKLLQSCIEAWHVIARTNRTRRMVKHKAMRAGIRAAASVKQAESMEIFFSWIRAVHDGKLVRAGELADERVAAANMRLNQQKIEGVQKAFGAQGKQLLTV